MSVVGPSDGHGRLVPTADARRAVEAGPQRPPVTPVAATTADCGGAQAASGGSGDRAGGSQGIRFERASTLRMVRASRGSAAGLAAHHPARGNRIDENVGRRAMPGGGRCPASRSTRCNPALAGAGRSPAKTSARSGVASNGSSATHCAADSVADRALHEPRWFRRLCPGDASTSCRVTLETAQRPSLSRNSQGRVGGAALTRLR